MASETPRRRHSLFKPCIDLHDGVVKQIVGGTLSDQAPAELKTNFVASQSSKEFALLYKKNSLEGGHVIKLGPGNDGAAKDTLSAWPGGLQVGGGITEDNAMEWIEAGASKVIVTSYLFPGARFSPERLENLAAKVGPQRLVVDVSEFLIHAADVEGLCKGIDEELVRRLGEWVKIPTTYAGGAKDISDLDLVDRLSGGKVDLTYGSALDIFGGSLVKFEELVKCNNEAKAKAGII
ncbi:Enzyme that catalyzes the fourth step in the histidine pathway [Tulasnella sp. 424]|nr:Enzyme that catalyzes the fourth step in the histidine pathway [Tulasnella sp. 424]KAG8982106.1 Enzyme that catalyzes the fourth step in the histidine pathway [Tulasnella sp. 425]